MQVDSIAVPPTPWHLASATPVLGRDEIHVWRASLDQSPSRIEYFRNVLVDDERARADRFHFEWHRARFIVSRGMLRSILGAYLRQVPERLRFTYGSHGKPALAGGNDAIRFNVSHSDGIALFAVADHWDVGIDVERVRSDLAATAIAARFFAPGEVAFIQSLPAEAQNKAFFRCWTRKEAYVKARGEGLSLPLDQLDVSADLSDPMPTGEARASHGGAAWSFRELAPAPGYIGALAVEALNWRLVCCEWPDDADRSYPIF